MFGRMCVMWGRKCVKVQKVYDTLVFDFREVTREKCGTDLI